MCCKVGAISSAIAGKTETLTFTDLLAPSDDRALSLGQVLQSFGLLEPGRSGVSDLAVAEPGDRPRVLLNMVSTVDGRATVAGRSGRIGNRADRELFHGLRSCVDGVMVGAGTARAEHYGRLIGSAESRQSRLRAGRTEEPLACIVSAGLSLSAAAVPLLGQPGAKVAILTPSEADLPQEGLAADLSYVRFAAPDATLDLPAAVGELRSAYGVGTLLCEGGPHLNAALLAADLVDELLLCLGAKLAGGSGPEAATRIVMGPEIEPPRELALLDALENDSYLFLRYGVRSEPAPERSRG